MCTKVLKFQEAFTWDLDFFNTEIIQSDKYLPLL